MLPQELVKFKNESKKIIALTAWDSITGSIAEEAGADMILIGDSLAMVALGYETTLPVTVENMIHHTNAVCRGFKNSFGKEPLVVCDMPFLSYQCGEDKAVDYAGRIIKETPAKAVKIEGAEPEIQLVISRLIRMGIPIMGHLGLTPQSFLNQGLKKQGNDFISKDKIRKESEILEKIGCFAIVLEHIPDSLSKEISNNLKIPIIGIGAGTDCDGQIRVTADLLGLNDKQPPFCEPLTNGKKIFTTKLREWINSEKLN